MPIIHIPVLWIRKLGPREGEQFAQEHTEQLGYVNRDGKTCPLLVASSPALTQVLDWKDKRKRAGTSTRSLPHDYGLDVDNCLRVLLP